MRLSFLISTLAFWGAIAALALAGAKAHDAAPSGSSATRIISSLELAQHAQPGDCWLAIRGGVYDITKYLPDHPSRPGVVEPWCGKEATQAYETKTKGREHFEAADRLLFTYRIGTFKQK
jgi:cytochrome b involved in lipid metabolism